MKWLYDSLGLPIAFEENGEVFTPDGIVFGEIDKNEVYNGYYKGEIIDDRLLVNKAKKYKFKGNLPLPGIHVTPTKPLMKYRTFLPPGLEDIEFSSNN